MKKLLCVFSSVCVLFAANAFANPICEGEAQAVAEAVALMNGQMIMNRDVPQPIRGEFPERLDWKFYLHSDNGDGTNQSVFSILLSKTDCRVLFVHNAPLGN